MTAGFMHAPTMNAIARQYKPGGHRPPLQWKGLRAPFLCKARDVITKRPGELVSDPFNLERFREAQDRIFDQVLGELRRGSKEGHWIWFIFPQMKGLGSSSTSAYYGIASRAEAEAYLA